MVSIEQLFPRQPYIVTAFHSFLVLLTGKRSHGQHIVFSPPNQSKLWKQPVNMNERVYKELPIVKKVELLHEAGSRSVRELA